jgi:oligopeptide transport system substrate-binding protein
MRLGKWIAACATSALILAGCGGKAADPQAAAGSILKVNLGAEVQDLDPQIVTGVPEHRALTALFAGLADLDPATLEPEPGAAESWTVSEDYLVYTFKLRANGKWSNGEPVTASDFEYAWQRMLSPGLAAEYSYLLHHIKGAKDYNDGKVADWTTVGVRTLDPLTLEVTLDHPTPFFLSMLYHQSFFPVHKATIEKFGKMDERGTKWTQAGNHVGNGAFKLTEWRPHEYILTARNEHYWDAANIRLDGVQFFPIDDMLTEERSFRTGEVHMTEQMPLHKIDVYRKENPEALQVRPYLGNYFYRFNTTRKPLDDVRVRLALSMAVDRETLCREVLKAGEPPAFNLTPPGTAGYTSNAKMTYDPERAKQLLAEAGFPNGEGFPKLELLYNTSETHATIAEVLQRMWKETLGIEIGLYNQDWKVYLDSMTNLDYDIVRGSWIGDVVDPLNFLELFLTEGGNNRTGWSSPKYDELIQQAYGTPDKEARYALQQEAEALLLEEAPMLPIYFYSTKYLKAPEVKGFTPNILDYRRWKDMWLETPAAS